MPFLVAIDLSAPSRHAIEVAALLARATGLTPLLLHVAEHDPTLHQLADLYGLAEPLRALGSNPSLRTEEGDPATCICAQAVARGCAFVVMGTHGRRSTAVEEPGSVARSVMARARIPVVAVRPQVAPRGASPASLGGVVSLVEKGASSPAATRIAGLLAGALHCRLLRAPAAGDRGTASLADGTTSTCPSHVVISVDPVRPALGWVEQILQREPATVVLVSDRPFAWGVSNATPEG
ncbi:MAG: universal stress protein [Pseudomonadota bacterium]